MINILPDAKKKEIRAAHSNVILIRYIIVLISGVAFLALMCFAVFVVLDDTKKSAQEVITLNEQGNSPYASALARASSLRSGLSSAKTILDNEVRYSKVLTSIATLMPEGTVLDSISLNSNLLDTPTNLTIYARSTEVAIKLRENFENSPIFSNVSFQGVNTSSSLQGYTVSATVNVTINKRAGQ